jgi:hypothetical protein
MRMNTRRVTAALLAAVMAGSVQADGAGVQFSADMVRHGPDGQSTTGKMFVGDRRTRMEMTQKGREVVRISNQPRGMEWVLFPADKSYLERAAPAGTAAAPAAPSAETDPCAGVQGLTCRRVGKEDVNGRPAVKWEMTATDQGKTLTGAQWLDVERGLPLKHLMPNGQAMELKLVGTEQLDGRAVEKWEVTSTAPNQPPVTAAQWYDPELKQAVREEFPGGYVSELKNIKVGPQPDDLFAPPAGYTLKPMPTPPPGAQPAGQPGGQPQPDGK